VEEVTRKKQIVIV